jgi:hypothetical protein
VSVQLDLGEDQLVVEGDLESSARGRDELQPGDAPAPAGEQGVRQTDGAGCVVSDDAELDADVVLVCHGSPFRTAARSGYPSW